MFTELVDELGDGYSYLPNGAIDEKEYVKSGPFHPFTKMQSEDLITVETDSHQFHLVESTLM